MEIKMRHGSLFSGIGGFDLAAEWMGWINVFHCEWMPFPQKILKHYWPNAISYYDITKTDFTIHRGDIDILSGGFPCQPYSAAGKRLGKEDERHLWPEMLRAIKEIAPTWVVGENVYGLTNWNGGMVFEEVCADLEDCGYEVQPVLLPACAKDAPHRRDRIWFVAYANGFGINRNIPTEKCNYEGQKSEDTIKQWNGWSSKIERHGKGRNATDTDCRGLERSIEVGRNGKHVVGENGIDLQKSNATDTDGDGLNQCNSQYEINPSEGGVDALNDLEQDALNAECIGWNEVGYDNGEFEKSQKTKCGEFKFGRTDCSQDWWRNFPSQSPICGGDDGLSTQLDGITFPKWRAESIKGYGNAVVPQVVFEIFKVIEKMNQK